MKKYAFFYFSEDNMKRIISLLLAFVLLFTSALCLFSCGEPKDDGAEIAVYLGERVYDFDPTDYYVDSNADQVMSLLYDPLFKLDEDGELELGGAAEDYEVDEETRTIVITLRESYWSNSKPVLASDFVYAWHKLLDPNAPNPAASLLYDVENALSIKSTGNLSVYELGAEATADNELTITYREGADYVQLLKNLSCVATAPIRNDVITPENGGYWSKIVDTAVTNGPFAIGTVDEKTNSFTLIRNVGYHQSLDVKDYTKQVRPGQLVSFIEPKNGSAALTYADIENKTVFYMADAPIADRAANKDEAMVADDLSTYTYVFNTEKPLFANEKIRQALSIVIDRNAIIEKIVFGKAATGFLPTPVIDTATGKTFGNGTLISASANKAEAEKLIREAKAELGDVSMSFTLKINDDEQSHAIADIVIAAWASIGFTVTKDAVSATETVIEKAVAEEPAAGEAATGETVNEEPIRFLDSDIQIAVKDAARNKKDFDVIAVDWQMYSTDAFVALSAFSTEFSGCGVELPYGNKTYASFGKYSNADYDKLIKDAYAATGSDRSALLHQAEEKLVKSACVIPLVFNQSFAFVSSDISKLSFDGLGNFVFTDVKQKNYRDYLD